MVRSLQTRFVFTLIVALMAFGTGTASAVSGISSDGSASEAQYTPQARGEQSPLDRVQESLPFTGLWLVPLLVGGVALTAAGGLLRSRLRERDQQ